MLNQIIQGDCLEVMASMQAGSVDMVFTSPPYNLKNTSGGGFNHPTYFSKNSKWNNARLFDGYDGCDDNLPYEIYVEWQKKVLLECWRLLSPAGAIFYNHKPRVQDALLQTPLDLNPGLPVRQIIIWKRAGGINFAPTHFVPTHEWIVIFAKPDFRLKNKSVSGYGDVWEIVQEDGKKNTHPAPFPVALPQRAISATNAQVILDPFMGSGSTALACINTGRNYIGIEKSGQYIELANRRIALAQMQGRFEEMVG
jgi:site-specific DNA-methyltransferase (adenine-specific)